MAIHRVCKGQLVTVWYLSACNSVHLYYISSLCLASCYRLTYFNTYPYNGEKPIGELTFCQVNCLNAISSVSTVIQSLHGNTLGLQGMTVLPGWYQWTLLWSPFQCRSLPQSWRQCQFQRFIPSSMKHCHNIWCMVGFSLLTWQYIRFAVRSSLLYRHARILERHNGHEIMAHVSSIFLHISNGLVIVCPQVGTIMIR